MARPRVFVSSTAYDLGAVRSQLRAFIDQLGYEPVLSDYGGILYDPRSHTHASCVKEIAGSDLAILIVGSRFGSTAVPDAVDLVDLDALREREKSIDELASDHKLSITQLEVLKAIEEDIPLFAFVDARVLADHQSFERNKHQDFISEMVFPSIENNETAQYIFQFINVLRHRAMNNAIFPFSKLEDIQTELSRQWAAFFQRLLQEQRLSQVESRRVETLSDQIEDLKTALLTTIDNRDARDIARGVVRYRLLIDALTSLGVDSEVIQASQETFAAVLQKQGVKGFVSIADERTTRIPSERGFLVFEDESIATMRISIDRFMELERDWASFVELSDQVRKHILDGLLETHGPRLRMVSRQIRPDVEMEVENAIHDGRAVMIPV